MPLPLTRMLTPVTTTLPAMRISQESVAHPPHWLDSAPTPEPSCRSRSAPGRQFPSTSLHCKLLCPLPSRHPSLYRLCRSRCIPPHMSRRDRISTVRLKPARPVDL